MFLQPQINLKDANQKFSQVPILAGEEVRRPSADHEQLVQHEGRIPHHVPGENVPVNAPGQAWRAVPTCKALKSLRSTSFLSYTRDKWWSNA